MPTVTLYPKDGPRWGSSGFTSSTEALKVGKSGSATYYGRVDFPAIPSSWYITSIRFRMKRIDDYSAKSLKIGSRGDGGWDNKTSTDFTKSISVSSGQNTKEWDLTAYKGILQGYGGRWYLHLRHGSGDNSYCEFAGGTSGSAPRLVIEYNEAFLTVPGGEFTIGVPAAIEVGATGSGLTHKLSYSVGGSSGVLNGGAEIVGGDVISWTPPASLAYEITGGMVGAVVLTLETFSGGVRTSVLSFSYPLRIPASYVPSITSASFSLMNPAGDDIGVYVQGRSRTLCSIVAVPVGGAQIVEYRLSIDGQICRVLLDEPASGSVGILTEPLASAGVLPAVVEVVDSRGQVGRLDVASAVSVNAYFPPMVTGFSVIRSDAAGVPNNDGTFIKVTLSCLFAALSNKNTKSGALRFKASGGSAFSAPISLDAAIASAGATVYAFTVTCQIGDGQIGSGAYLVAATLSDRYNASAEVYAELPSKLIYFDLHSSGEGMAVGGEAVVPSLFDVYIPARFRGAVQFDDPDSLREGLAITPLGLGMQMGAVSTTLPSGDVKTGTVTFPQPYASAPLVFLTNNVNAGSVQYTEKLHVSAVSATGFTWQLSYSGGSGNSAKINWLAIGTLA